MTIKLSIQSITKCIDMEKVTDDCYELLLRPSTKKFLLSEQAAYQQKVENYSKKVKESNLTELQTELGNFALNILGIKKELESTQKSLAEIAKPIPSGGHHEYKGDCVWRHSPHLSTDIPCQTKQTNLKSKEKEEKQKLEQQNRELEALKKLLEERTEFEKIEAEVSFLETLKGQLIEKSQLISSDMYCLEEEVPKAGANPGFTPDHPEL